MSNGYSPVNITVISQDKLSELCPVTFFKLFETMARFNLDEEITFLFLNGEENLCEEDGASDLQEAWEELKYDFEEKTTLPNGKRLTLYCGYHDPDNGGCYDDIEGAFFSVDGVYERSQAGEVFKDILTDVAFVTYG